MKEVKNLLVRAWGTARCSCIAYAYLHAVDIFTVYLASIYTCGYFHSVSSLYLYLWILS
jgi:hypothetical protein